MEQASWFSDPGIASANIPQTDASLLDTAIRETSEELGVEPGQIEYLGRFAEPEVSYKGLVVWPMLASASHLRLHATMTDESTRRPSFTQRPNGQEQTSYHHSTCLSFDCPPQRCKV
jgi:ADP-ribose pyrophosphatase YjhB (NUDIX family)